MRSLFLGLFVVCLTACSGPDPRYMMEPLKWGDVVVKVETRPMPVRTGMNEFLVIATTERGRPVFDMIVSLRADHRLDWAQGIQDGHSGVYRKAALVPEGATHLYVQLRKHGTEEGEILAFPLIFEGSL